MTRKLQINVQVDRLPKLPGDNTDYFGVRLSAWIDADVADRAVAADEPMLLPWQWTGADPTQPGTWAPTAASSWKAWWIDVHPTGAPPTHVATPATVTPIPNPAASALPLEWTQRLKATVDDLAKIATSFEGPASSGPNDRPAPVTGRPLFGFVESLSVLPSPWPEAHKVWTCLRVDTPAPTNTCELVLAPVFGVNVPGGVSGTYSIAVAPNNFHGNLTDHFWQITYTGAPAGLLSATAVVDRLVEANSVDARILLKNQFLIKKGSWADVSNQDWMVQLPMQIAEILDPAQAFTKAFDALLPTMEQLWEAAHDTPAANRTPQQIELLASLPASPDLPPLDLITSPTLQGSKRRAALRLLLGALHWRVLAPCATGTQAVTPLPVAIARANVNADSQNLLAGLTARDATRPTLDGTLPGFMTSEPLQVWKDGHLETLLGLPADKLSLAWGPSVDVTDELRAFLIGHWVDSGPQPPAVPGWPSRGLTLTTNQTAIMQMITMALQWNGATWSMVRDPDRSIGLFDLSALSAPGSASVSLAMSVSLANAVVTASLWLDGATAPIATASSTPIVPGDRHILTLSVTSSAPGPAHFGVSVLLQSGDNVAGAPAPVADAGFFNNRAYIKLQLAAAGPKVELKTSNTLSLDAVSNLLRNTPDTALRASAAVGHIAPFIPSILQGVGPNGNSVRPAPLAPATAPAVRLRLALQAWAQDRFHAECEAAIKLVEDQLAPPLPAPPAAVMAPLTHSDITAVEPLFRFVAKYAAVAVANAQIQKLVNSLSPEIDYAVSVKATPVAFPIDQPQPIDGSQDIWSMFAGVGVLAGLSLDAAAPWPENNIWYSLNLANMYVSPGAPAEPVLVAGPRGGFDPVPLQVGEVGGVRAATITYENRSLVGQMPHEWDHTSSSLPRRMPRRIESYKFPTAQNAGGNPKLPALSFGKRVFFLPYLVGHGGALPVCLRAHPTSPTTLRPKTVNGDPVRDTSGNPVLGKDGNPITDPGGRIVFAHADLTKDIAGLTDDAGQPLTPSDLVRAINYRRTTPVAAPRISSEGPLPGIPDGVEPLASELPITPAAITIASQETVYFYCNKEKTEGVLDFTAADAGRNFLQVVLGTPPNASSAAPGAWPALQVGFAGRGQSSLPPSVTIAAKEAGCPGVRLTVNAQGTSVAKQLSRPSGDPFVERPPQYGSESAISAQAVDFTEWQAFFISITNSSATDVTLLPPKVSLGSVEVDPQDKTKTITTLREIPLPGVPQQKRVITVLDGIAPVLPRLGSVTLRVRRPAVEFSTFERWINWDLSDRDVGEKLNKAYALVAQTNPTRNDDLVIDDPAVEKVVVELIELFPSPQSHGQRFVNGDWSSKASIIGGFGSYRSPDPSVVVRIARNSNEPAGITPTGTDPVKEIVLVPGGVYEVRFSGAIPEGKQKLADSAPPAAQRFGKGVWQGLQKFSAPAGGNYRLGPPLSLTFEVSTDSMPTMIRKRDDADRDTPFQADRVVAQSGDKARVTLRQSFVMNNYPAARYVNRVSLLSQRWGWRGRPAGTLPPLEEFPAKLGRTALSPALPPDRSSRLAPGDVKDFESIAFVDRRDDDIGVIEEVKLHLAHLMPAVDSGGALKPADDDGRPPLLSKDLLYRGGANWWRFALSATSRYAAMKPGRDLVRYSHVNPQQQTTGDWHTLIVRDRETGRMPKRPGLILVLPLTETVMSDTAIPPLLAIFSEPMFPGFHVGDGIDAVLDYARYPLPDQQRFWPEFGPDPILTGVPHSGAPVPIRTDGPIGYTFDVGTEAPHFGRSGYLVTPISGMDNSEIRPWSLARLRFRRLEAIELSLYPAYPVSVGGAATKLLLTCAGLTLDPAAKAIPSEYHEGLVVDFAQLTPQAKSAKISAMPGPHQPQAPAAPVGVPPTLTVQGTADSEKLTIEITSSLGSAGTYRLAMRPAGRAWMRVVLSQRDKPQDGAQPYQPILDVAIRLLVEDGEEGLVRSLAGSWMTIACVPLLADGKTFMPTNPVFVNVEPTGDRDKPLQAYGARLTSFTPPVWCQFTQDVSRFDVATIANPSFNNYSVGDMVVTLAKDKAPILAVKSDNAAPQVVQSIKWLQPDDDSQVASVVAAVVTEFIADISDRVRERPVAVYRLDDSTTPGTPVSPRLIWPTDPMERAKIASTAPARVRLMSLMHLQLDASAPPPASLADYFNEPFEDAISMTASDAVGRILGVSKPIEIAK